MANDLDILLAALRAIAEPTRIRIVALCRAGDLTVGELCRILGQSQPRVSRHLKLLVDAGVLEKLPEGASVFHRLTQDGLAAIATHHISSILPETENILRHDQSRLSQIKHERDTKAAEYFNTNARHWNSLRAMHVDDRHVEASIQEMLGDGNLGDLLDVGTGTGRMLELLSAKCHQAEGIDNSREMLNIARSSLARQELVNCQVRQGDMYDLPFAENSFDTVLFHQVLHYADAPELAVQEAARVLRPRGRLLIVDFAPHSVEELRTVHAHRRMGFPAKEVGGWFSAIGMRTRKQQTLEGEPLSVSLWLAEKPKRTAVSLSPRSASHQQSQRPTLPRNN